MINAILLLVSPVPTWKRLASQNQNAWLTLLISLLPLMIIACGVDAWVMIHVGAPVPGLTSVRNVPLDLGMRYATTYVVFGLIGIIVAAVMIRQICLGIQIRQTFNQCLLLAVYCTAPAFIIRFADAWNALNTWVVLGVAVFFIFSAAYSGVPNLMKPDPAKAFGLFFTAAILLSICHAAVHAIAYMVLQERLFKGGLGIGILGF